MSNTIQNTQDIEKTYVKDVYEKIAKHFDVTRSYRWTWIDTFLDNTPKNSLVLDLGCGSGRNMIHKDLNFIGVDYAKNFIDICKDKGLNVINSNILNVPLSNNSADAIICIAVLHHIALYENQLRALLEIKRLIKPGGKILLSVWSLIQPEKTKKKFNDYGNNIVIWNSYGKIYERFYYIFKFQELQKLFKDAGLIVLNHEYNCGNEIFVLTSKMGG